MTPATLARLQSAVSAVEPPALVKAPSVDVAVAIANALKVDVQTLFPPKEQEAA